MNIFREFLDSSTIHGLAYISNVTSKTGKALWLTIVIGGFCTAGYLINSSFEEWRATPVATSISTHPISLLSLPVITICPPEQSNTALNVDLVKAGNITLVDTDRQALKNVSRELLIHEPSQRFVEIVSRAINKEALAQLKAQTRSYPLPKENSNAENSQHFEIWSTEVSGSYKIGSQTNCSEDHPNISLTLYIGQNLM